MAERSYPAQWMDAAHLFSTVVLVGIGQNWGDCNTILDMEGGYVYGLPPEQCGASLYCESETLPIWTKTVEKRGPVREKHIRISCSGPWDRFISTDHFAGQVPWAFSVLQSPQFWPIPTRTAVLNRCTADNDWAGNEVSANQQLCGLQVVLGAIGQN